MQVTLKDHTLDPEHKIGLAAAKCYDGGRDRESNVRRTRGCKDKGHLSTLRFAYATFDITGISRVCSHQLVRMAHAGILQRSQRFCREDGIEYVKPTGFDTIPPALQGRWDALLAEANSLYGELVDGKHMRAEDARYVLPQSCVTELSICLNFQGYRDLLKARTSKAAQWEVRAVALEIQRQLAEIAPGLF